MRDLATPSFTVAELKAILHVLTDVCERPTDVATSDVELDARTVALFKLLHAQLRDLRWRPGPLTLAPWAVEALCRVLSTVETPTARRTPLPGGKPKPAKAALPPADAALAAVAGEKA